MNTNVNPYNKIYYNKIRSVDYTGILHCVYLPDSPVDFLLFNRRTVDSNSKVNVQNVYVYVTSQHRRLLHVLMHKGIIIKEH